MSYHEPPPTPDAACRGHDPSLWFPARGEDTAAAQHICAACPHMEPCADWGVRHELEGVWGGLTARQRRKMRSARRIRLQRPDTLRRRA